MKRRNFLGAAVLPLLAPACGHKPNKQPQSALPPQVQSVLDTLYAQFHALLLDDIVPFWEKYGVDPKSGVVATCLTDDGALVSEDRYVYSVARALWTFSALYNRVEKRPRWLDTAKKTARFLLDHGRDSHGDWYYRLAPDGAVKEGPVSIWSDCFACYGLIEYSRAAKDQSAFDVAVATLKRIRERTTRDDFNAVAPFQIPPGVMTHGVSMMEVMLSDEILRLKTNLSDITRINETAMDQIMHRHLNNERKILFENIRRDGAPLDTPEGRFVIPGHAIESMWGIMRTASREGNDTLAREAAEAMRWHLEAGWDKENGGILYSLDSTGAEPDLPLYPRWDTKMWWVHTEALLGMVLAYENTQADWVIGWYPQVYEYTMRHFSAGAGKDWHERCNRKGEAMTAQEGLPVKDFFHTPRMCIMIMEAIDRMEKT